jgi:hypothetical protein
VADLERRSALLALKLTALVRDHAGEGAVVAGLWPGGAALVRDGEAWVLADERPERALGPALAWADQQGAAALHLLAEGDHVGVLARRARFFASPTPEVLRVDGRALVPVEPASFTPPGGVLDARFAPFYGLMEGAGVTPVLEHGVLTGEAGGLEVCRAVIDPDLDVARLEVGIGAHDREAFALLHGDVPTDEALATVAHQIAAHRRPGAEPHPLNRIAPERLLRHLLVLDPAPIGLVSLAPAPPPVPRPRLQDVAPCAAIGVDPDGGAVVVVCSTGVDLDVVPWAADARAALGLPDAPLLVVVPGRDALPVTLRLAARLVRPATVIGLRL